MQFGSNEKQHKNNMISTSYSNLFDFYKYVFILNFIPVLCGTFHMQAKKLTGMKRVKDSDLENGSLTTV